MTQLRAAIQLAAAAASKPTRTAVPSSARRAPRCWPRRWSSEAPLSGSPPGGARCRSGTGARPRVPRRGGENCLAGGIDRPTRHAGHLPLDVRAAARTAVSDVHLVPRLDRHPAPRHLAAARLCGVGRSPVVRQRAFARERGWRNLKFCATVGVDFARGYRGLASDGSEWPALDVGVRRDGRVRHFLGAELGGTSDPGQDASGAPDPTPLRNILDLAPRGPRNRLVTEAQLSERSLAGPSGAR